MDQLKFEGLTKRVKLLHFRIRATHASQFLALIKPLAFPRGKSGFLQF
jgi:hypothetical protein